MKRNGEIDCYKFLFAMIIVLFHSNNFAASGESLFPSGDIGVEFFFIVSGYLMAASSGKVHLTADQSAGPQTLRFLAKKVKKILPDIYIVWVIAFIVEACTRQWNFLQVIKNGMFTSFELLLVQQTGLKGFCANPVTWYLSAMLLAMALLYPFLIKNRSLFLCLAAPLITVFVTGYMFQNWSLGLKGPSVWLGFAFKGFIRAFAEISLGCVCYTLSQQLKACRPTKLFSILLAVLQTGCYLFIFIFALYGKHSALDFVVLLVMAIAITITFSENSILSGLLKSPGWAKVGRFSYDLFLSHGFWSHAMSAMFLHLNYWQKLPLYLAFSFLTALLVMYASSVLLRFWPAISAKIKMLLLRS